MAEAETETGVELFNRVIGIAMGVPGITVDRAAFLRREFSVYCRPEQLDLILNSAPFTLVNRRLRRGLQF